MEIKRLRTLITEIFKTLHDINPNYMKEIFYLSPHETDKKYGLFAHPRNATKYGSSRTSYLKLFTRRNKCNYLH